MTTTSLRLLVLSTFSSFLVARVYSLQDLSFLTRPTVDDVSFTTWTTKNGIFAPSVTCLTTSRSVGGRGLFALSDMSAGQIIASIPHTLIFSTTEEQWAADITRQVLGVSASDPRKEWVDSWSGGGCTSWKQVEELISNVDVDQSVVRELEKSLEDRIQTFRRVSSDFGLREEDLPLYALIASRACYLGPSWKLANGNPAVGVVPFFDMLNHHASKSNVELLSFGTAFSLLKSDSARPTDLNDKDMLLKATRRIEKGEELFTHYLVEDGSAVNTAHKVVSWAFI